MMTGALVPTGLHPPDDPRAAAVVEHTRIDIAGPEAIAIVTDLAAFQFASKWCLRDREAFVSVVRELTIGFANSTAALSPRPASVMLRLRWTAHGAIGIDLWDNVDPATGRRYRRCLTTRLHLQRDRAEPTAPRCEARP
ncbi:hypothetical protein IU438_18800 [Nocardia cyriacigeorgica]|uniref:hypothetical protein n=1 Tax=Nocardia cyriacigeorgica TaxID=135487 RepID=UPI001892F25B|nr:hypothetical protein [Nocardia cyriacigeorgica]MBF6397842.1 hypothetical protein [Nocardia cyriacigeorgica]MBF6402501.1 hypothetical protein [Nocardia cyriacigeorgica]